MIQAEVRRKAMNCFSRERYKRNEWKQYGTQEVSYFAGIARIKLAHRGRRIELLLVARGGYRSIGRRV